MDDGFAGYTIYIVDDNPLTAQSYEDALKMEFQCNIEKAIGPSAKSVACSRLSTSFAPSLILLDVWLPQPEDGYHVCRHSKELRPEIQVVMITAVSDEEEYLCKGLEAGADDFLSKGAQHSEFIARVRSKLYTRALHDKLLAAQRAAYLEYLVTEATEAGYQDLLKWLREKFRGL